jgi:hypothetical protein
VRYRTLRGKFTDDGAAGVNVRTLPRRFRRARLPEGSYRLVLRAVDDVGNASRKTKRFTVG